MRIVKKSVKKRSNNARRREQINSVYDSEYLIFITNTIEK